MSLAASGVVRRMLRLLRASLVNWPGSARRSAFPAGLCLGDDGLLHQRKGGGGNALERSAQQVKARKAEEALQRLASEPMALASMEIWELLAETWMYSSSRPSVFRLS